MNAVKNFLGLALVVSVGLNVFLWRQREAGRAEAQALSAHAVEAEALRAENEELKTRSSTAKSATSDADARELARLRNEVGQLRKKAADVESERAKTERELAQLRARLGTTEQSLAEKNQEANELARMTPEQIAQAKRQASFARCINNVKQIGLACRLYANDHGGVFPPDLVSLKKELVTPKVLFCTAASGVVPAVTWEELDPKTISYQLLNPGGNDRNPQVPLSSCSVCGNYGLSDGSAQRAPK